MNAPLTAKSNDSKKPPKKPAKPIRARLVRYYNPKYLHEVTIRTNNGKFAFDPNNEELSRQIIGLLFLAATIYNIKIIAIHFMSNHYHGLFDIPSSGRFCKFLMYFHGNLARLGYEHLGTKGKFWSDNKWVAVAQDEVSVARRIRYILGQAVKARLVEHPIQFPGVSCARPMIDGKPLIGSVIDLTQRYRDAQLKAGAGPLEVYTRPVEVAISPPPCWSDLSPGELQLRYRAIADEAAVTPLHVIRKTPLLGGPPAQRPAEVPAADEPSVQPPALTRCYTPETEAVCGETVRIPPRESESGKPYEQGPPTPKKRGEKPKRMPYLLSANLQEVLEYERQYLQICEVYADAKCRWLARARSNATGLSGPKFRLPQHTLVGTMPLVD